MSEARFLPYGRQEIGDDDIAAVAAVLRSDFLTTGPAVGQFEKALADAVDAPFAVVCGNGTQALHLAAVAAGLGPGDWAIVPTVTFLATANAVRYTGAEVVFADVDPYTGLVNADHLAEAARRAKGTIKAVLPVHLGGLPADPEKIGAFARQSGWRVIEDACHALGTRYLNRDGREESIGDARHADSCVFSFHPVKTIAMGEGGAITTRDEATAHRMRLLRSHGMVHAPEAFRYPELGLTEGMLNPWYYEMQEIGFNYRLPDLACALGTSQLGKLRRFIDRRAELVALYRRAFQPAGNLIQVIDAPQGVQPGWHLLRIRIDFSAAALTRAELMSRLKAESIGTQVHYIPVHWQPYYRDRYGEIELPGARRYYDRILSLPLFSTLTDNEAVRVAETVMRLILR